MTEDKIKGRANLLGENIRSYRKSLKLRREEIAKKMEVSTSTLGQWERGERLPLLDNLYKLADILQVGVSDLLEDSVAKERAVMDYRLARAIKLTDKLFDRKNPLFEGLAGVAVSGDKIAMELPTFGDGTKRYFFYPRRQEFISIIEHLVESAIEKNCTILDEFKKFLASEVNFHTEQ